MRRVLTFVLLASMVALQLGNRWAVYVAWKMNQEYIARELCENRDRPEMGCEGRCCLKKELRKVEEQERKAERIVIPEIAPAIPAELFSLAVWNASAGTADLMQEYPAGAEGSIVRYAACPWQPPEVA